MKTSKHRSAVMTEGGMYRKKPPRRKNTGPGWYALSGQIFSATSLSDAKKQAREWRVKLRAKRRENDH